MTMIIHVRLPEELAIQVRHWAVDNGLNASEAAAQLIREAFEAKGYRFTSNDRRTP